MTDTKQNEKKEARQLSLFTNERHEDLAAIIGAGVLMLLTVIFI